MGFGVRVRVMAIRKGNVLPTVTVSYAVLGSGLFVRNVFLSWRERTVRGQCVRGGGVGPSEKVTFSPLPVSYAVSVQDCSS